MTSTLSHDELVERLYNDVSRSRILRDAAGSQDEWLVQHAYYVRAATDYRRVTGQDHIDVMVFGLDPR